MMAQFPDTNLVAKGFHQQAGFGFFRDLQSVVKPATSAWFLL